MKFLRYTLLLVGLLFAHGASAQCVPTGGYPFVPGGCLTSNSLNNIVQLNQGITPPHNSNGQGALPGTLWLDTSGTPFSLRYCNSNPCGASYVGSQWSVWATVDPVTGLMTPITYNRALGLRIITSGTSDIVGSSDFAILWNSITNAVKSETLPLCNVSNRGQVLVITDVSGNAYGYPITVGAQFSNSINGSAFYTINNNNSSISLTCDGTSNWLVYAGYNNQISNQLNGGTDQVVVSSSNTELGAYENSNITISGNSSITSFGTLTPAGILKVLTFTGTPTLVSSSSMILQSGGANVQVSAGSTAVVKSLGAGNWRVISYLDSSGHSLGVQPISAGGTGSTTAIGARLALGLSHDANVLDYVSGSGATTAGSINSGSDVLNMASALDFANLPVCQGTSPNCGVVILGAGATPSVSVPTSVAVSTACSGTSGSITTISGSYAATTAIPSYTIVVGDSIVGTGIPSNTTVVSYDAQTSLIRMSNAATASNTITGTISDLCNATYYYKIATYDISGGISTPSSTVSVSGAPVHFIGGVLENCLSWGRPITATNLAGYAIWRSTDGVNYHFLQASNTEGQIGTCGGTSSGVYDFGLPTSWRPWWIPDNPGTIPSGQSDWLRTTVASGQGTTSLSLAANAQTTVTNSLVLHDDTNGWLAFENAINSGQDGVIPSYSTYTGNPVQIRIATSETLSRTNLKLSAGAGSTIYPFGTNFPTGVLYPAGVPSSSLTIGGNWQKGSTCLPISSSSIGSISLGQFLLIEQAAPGGQSEAGLYTTISKVSQIGCELGPNSIRLMDASDVTYTDTLHTEKVTLTGTVAVNDILTVTSAGDAICSASYTVVTGDTINTAIEGLALSWDAQCGKISDATTTLNVLTFKTPSAYSLTWTVGTTLGGGGTESLAATVGIAATIQILVPITGISMEGITIDGTDALGNESGSFFTPFYSYIVADSSFKHLHFRNVATGGATLQNYLYRDIYDDIQVENGSYGASNLASYSDLWFNYGSNLTVSNSGSRNSFSFGTQFFSISNSNISNIQIGTTYAGRAFKLAGVIGSNISGLNISGGAWKGLAICCGSERNNFSNINVLGSFGINNDGIGYFDSWSRHNYFTNIRSIGQPYAIQQYWTDYDNQYVNVDTGVSNLSNIFSSNISSHFNNVNGCELAYNSSVSPSTTPNPTCQRFNGTWTPTIAGLTTAGTTTYATQIGTWDRNDRLITARFSLVTNAPLTGATGNVAIEGLPFSSAGTAEQGSCSLAVMQGVTFDTGYVGFSFLGLMVNGAESQIRLYENGSGQTYNPLPSTDLGNPVTLVGSCSYPVQ